jgi:hypothetical protein
MRYILVPTPVNVVQRNGDPVYGPPTLGPDGRTPQRGAVLPPVTLHDYAECWWQSEKLNAGGYKGRRVAEKILAAFDKAKEANAAFVALEDAEFEKLKPIAEESALFNHVALELQCKRFVEAVLDAKTEPPAVLAIATDDSEPKEVQPS